MKGRKEETKGKKRRGREKMKSRVGKGEKKR